MAKQPSHTERVRDSFKQLSLAATNLNSASDELNGAVSILDAELQKLNLGVPAWVEVSGTSRSNTRHWWSRDIGYAKIGDKWGIALREAEGDRQDPEFDLEHKWPFNEGPRWMRVEAVPKIPDLLEHLLKQTEETTKKIKSKTTQVREIAAAISGAELLTAYPDQASVADLPSIFSAMSAPASGADFSGITSITSSIADAAKGLALLDLGSVTAAVDGGPVPVPDVATAIKCNR